MGSAEILLKILAWRVQSETNQMIPNLTHLFSHWSIPLNIEYSTIQLSYLVVGLFLHQVPSSPTCSSPDRQESLYETFYRYQWFTYFHFLTWSPWGRLMFLHLSHRLINIQITKLLKNYPPWRRVQNTLAFGSDVKKCPTSRGAQLIIH